MGTEDQLMDQAQSSDTFFQLLDSAKKKSYVKIDIFCGKK